MTSNSDRYFTCLAYRIKVAIVTLALWGWPLISLGNGLTIRGNSVIIDSIPKTELELPDVIGTDKLHRFPGVRCLGTDFQYYVLARGIL